MNAAEAKEWLSRGFWLRREKEQIIRMRGELLERLTNGTQDLTGVNVSGTKEPHKFDTVVALDEKLMEREAQIDKIRLEIYTVIRGVQDVRLRMILMARYCEYMSWPEIQTIVHCTERHVFRLHGEALQQVAPLIEIKIGGNNDGR